MIDWIVGGFTIIILAAFAMFGYYNGKPSATVRIISLILLALTCFDLYSDVTGGC